LRIGLVLIIVLLSFASGCGEKRRSSDPKFQQYFTQGESLYIKHCSNCHQPTGKGLGRVYPPVDRSDFIDNNRDRVICIIKYGMEGPVWVNGIEYNMAMKGNFSLSELEVAEIATYLLNNWSRQEGIIEVKEVTTILASCTK
jgi:cytochrome c551